MTDRSDSACVLLGMDDLVVKAVTEEEGELLVLVETETRPVGCPACGMRAEFKGRHTHQLAPRPRGLGSPDGACLEQASVVLQGPGLSGQDLDRTGGGHRATGRTHRPGPCRDRPVHRRGGAFAGRGGEELRRLVVECLGRLRGRGRRAHRGPPRAHRRCLCHGRRRDPVLGRDQGPPAHLCHRDGRSAPGHPPRGDRGSLGEASSRLVGRPAD